MEKGVSDEKKYLNGYVFGFNGQEKDNEIAGIGNSNTAQFWQYDTRLGRRWNLDPVDQIGISNYAVMGLNPIWFNDPLGNVFDVADNKQSKDDVNSLARDENQKFIRYKKNENGTLNVSLDFGKEKTPEEVKKLMKNDEGLVLINDMDKSPKKMLYEATNIGLYRDANGAKAGEHLWAMNDPVLNVSDNGFDSNNELGSLPKAGYNGQVVISPNAVFYENHRSNSEIVVSKSRASLVFHEIAEIYYRTHGGVNYYGTFKKPGAHRLAAIRELKWHGKSNNPGGIKNTYFPPKDRKIIDFEFKIIDDYIKN